MPPGIRKIKEKSEAYQELALGSISMNTMGSGGNCGILEQTDSV